MEKDPKIGVGLDKDARCGIFWSEGLIVVRLVTVQTAFCWFSYFVMSEVCAGLGNGCERFVHRDLC